jgi:hypothetical protein
MDNINMVVTVTMFTVVSMVSLFTVVILITTVNFLAIFALITTVSLVTTVNVGNMVAMVSGTYVHMGIGADWIKLAQDGAQRRLLPREILNSCLDNIRQRKYVVIENMHKNKP